MKHVKYLPFLIGAASYVPRAHAAEALQAAEPGALSILLVCLCLIVLTCANHRRTAAIKLED
ncbi:MULTISPECIES: hypothetical protein [unclassified Duganella]|uniref:hypothetical protein n=1 Tax=unclassified Duganella TaxID=2636909 RepID=UPI00087E0DD0|nr:MULTISPECIES: hypothetical protein [unclassified Duganella]SDH31295.1 hypothetical protein SAMN05216320_11212 [Duganella sp. OV458]SDK48164.1 hypothetical protein SAMN05428973_11212 [Duganella sp. OV510]